MREQVYNPELGLGLICVYSEWNLTCSGTLIEVVVVQHVQF